MNSNALTELATENEKLRPDLEAVIILTETEFMAVLNAQKRLRGFTLLRRHLP